MENLLSWPFGKDCNAVLKMFTLEICTFYHFHIGYFPATATCIQNQGAVITLLLLMLFSLETVNLILTYL